jgi:hypothetical protein
MICCIVAPNIEGRQPSNTQLSLAHVTHVVMFEHSFPHLLPVHSARKYIALTAGEAYMLVLCQGYMQYAVLDNG